MQAADGLCFNQGFHVCIRMWHTVSMDSTELKDVADAYHRAKRRYEERRDALREAVRAADADGMRQFEIVAATGLTRDYIRKIVNPELAKPKSKRSAS